MISDYPLTLWFSSEKGSLIGVRSHDEDNQALISSLSWDRAILVGYWCCALLQESSIGVCIVDIAQGDQCTFGEA